jgi:hypothetical protein
MTPINPPFPIPYLDHNFPDAAKLYTQAIELDPTDKTYWCNRATARMKLEEYGYALNDASQFVFGLLWWVQIYVLIFRSGNKAGPDVCKRVLSVCIISSSVIVC